MPVRWLAPGTLASGVESVPGNVWSFGVVLWEIVTLGATPYSDGGHAALTCSTHTVAVPESQVAAHVTGGQRLPRPAHVSPNVHDVCSSCWRAGAARPSFSALSKTLGALALDTASHSAVAEFEALPIDSGLEESGVRATSDTTLRTSIRPTATPAQRSRTALRLTRGTTESDHYERPGVEQVASSSTDDMEVNAAYLSVPVLVDNDYTSPLVLMPHHVAAAVTESGTDGPEYVNKAAIASSRTGSATFSTHETLSIGVDVAPTYGNQDAIDSLWQADQAEYSRLVSQTAPTYSNTAASNSVPVSTSYSRLDRNPQPSNAGEYAAPEQSSYGRLQGGSSVRAEGGYDSLKRSRATDGVVYGFVHE